MAIKLNPMVMEREDMRGRGYGANGPVTDPPVELYWNGGGYCIRLGANQEGGVWYYKDRSNGRLVLAQENEQKLWSELAARNRR